MTEISESLSYSQFNTKIDKKLIMRLQNRVNKMSTLEIFNKSHNEDLTPINTWYNDKNIKYAFFDIHSREFNLRFYNNQLLNPLITKKYKLIQSTDTLQNTPLYMPNYMENYYKVYEIMHLFFQNLYDKKIKCLNISKFENLGGIESIINYIERNCINYLDSSYKTFLLDNKKNKNNILDELYDHKTQLYNYDIINKDYTLYNLVYFDATYKLKYNNKYITHQESDKLTEEINILFTILPKIKKNNDLIYRRYICYDNIDFKLIIFINNFFKNIKFYRPKTCNILEQSIFIICKDYIYDRKKINIMRDNSLLLEEKINLIINNNNNHGENILDKYNNFIYNYLNYQFKYIHHGINNYKFNINVERVRQLKQNINNNFISLNFSPQNNIFSKESDINQTSNLNFTCLYEILQEKKRELNSYKRIIDSKPSFLFKKYGEESGNNDLFIIWDKLIDKLCFSKYIKYHIKNNINCEIVSNAWLKFYEILFHFKDEIFHMEELKSFHLCEAPGAFISALNHVIHTDDKLKNKIKWNWHAQSLNPKIKHKKYNFNVLGDDYNLIDKYPNNWIFGPPDDQSGDITNIEVIKYYTSLNLNINFITSDAGIEINPKMINEQEIYLHKINLSQIYLILSMLNDNGIAIFKTFLPLCENLTISLIYILNNCFDKMYLTKPETSKPSNSEIYVVCFGYHKMPIECINKIFNILKNNNYYYHTMLFNEQLLNNDFIEKYKENIISLIDRQIQSLKNDCYYYYNYYSASIFKEYTDKMKLRRKNWMKNNNLKKLDSKYKLLKKN